MFAPTPIQPGHSSTLKFIGIHKAGGACMRECVFQKSAPNGVFIIVRVCGARVLLVSFST